MDRDRFRRVHVLNLSQHLITEIPVPPMATFEQDLMLIQLSSPCTFNMLLTYKPRV